MAIAWDTSKPVSGTNIIDIPSIHANNWQAFQETFSHEHYDFADTTSANGTTTNVSGYHKPGLTTVICAGASATREGFTSPLSGCMMLDTEQSSIFIASGTVWESTSASGTGFRRTVIIAEDALDSSYTDTDWHVMPFATDIIDMGGNRWDSNRLTPSSSGTYLLSVTATLKGYPDQEFNIRFRYEYYSASILTTGTIATFTTKCKSTSGDSASFQCIWDHPYGADVYPTSGSPIWVEAQLADYSATGGWSTLTTSGAGNIQTSLCIVRLY